MKNPFRRQTDSKALTATPAVQQSIESGIANFSSQVGGGGLGAISRNRINEAFLLYENVEYGTLYERVPAVRTCVDFLARQIVQLNLELYGYNEDGEREDVDDHPAADLIENPNSFTPGKSWLYAMVADYLIYGNSYSLKIRPNNDPSSFRLYQIPAWKVSPIGQSIFEIERYKITGERGAYEYVEPEDVVHIKDYNPSDNRRGFSKLETLRKVLQEDITMTETNIELMKSGLTGLGNAFITRPGEAPEWTDEERERFQAFLSASMKKSAEVFPVIEDGMTVVQPNLSPQKAQLLESRKFSLETVAKLYGIPVGLLDGSVGDVVAQTANLYQDVLPPICDIFQGFLNQDILEAEFPLEDLCYEFDLKSKLRGDNQARLAQLVSVSGGPILTRNEARGMEGLEPLDDVEADELITPLNVTVGGKPSPHVMPVQDPNGPPQDGSHREPIPQIVGTPPAPVEKSAPKLEGAKKAATDLESETKADEVETKALILARRKNQDRRRNEYSDDLQGILTRHLSRQQASMRAKAAEPEEAASDRWNGELAADLLPVFNRQVKHEGDVAATRLGLPGFDTGKVKHYLEAKAGDVATNFNKATQTALGDPEAAAADVFAVAKSDRALSLATTLATGLSSFSHVEAAKQDQNVSQRMKTWIVTSQNSRHPEMSGESVPLFGEFSNGCQMPGSGGDASETAGCMCLVEVA